MTAVAPKRSQIRLFLDTGVIIRGCLAPWGAPKAVLILATLRARFTIVLGEATEREIRRVIAPGDDRQTIRLAVDLSRSVAGWLDRVRIERVPMPSKEEIAAHAPRLLPALRHLNDLPVVVSALLAQPDRVISDNLDHWNKELAARSGLRIVSPLEFLQELTTHYPPT